MELTKEVKERLDKATSCLKKVVTFNYKWKDINETKQILCLEVRLAFDLNHEMAVTIFGHIVHDSPYTANFIIFPEEIISVSDKEYNHYLDVIEEQKNKK